ncbi:myosin-2 heavy chain-like [Juglans microcarpa x Juglans regia]|uniref:myosin-2 heavy chain-like n=1 Tax=Juglans microcarpa x Juglans regia TaxID=2249226 RepID=UPI001B7ED37B|nr:myosin-2 heavy chain-like [Juglans microcarpa x Juglans regia]
MANKNFSPASRHKQASPAPSSSTDSPLSDDSPAMYPVEYERVVGAFMFGDHIRALELVDDALSSYPDSALLRSTRNVIHYRAASLLRDQKSKVEYLKKAAEFAGLAFAMAPNSISCARLNVAMLFELTEIASPTSVSDYEEVIRHCENALMLKNPADPLEGSLGKTKAERVLSVRKEFLTVIEKAKTRINFLGGANSKDWLKKLVENDFLSSVKKGFENIEQLRKEITEPMPLKAIFPASSRASKDDRLTEKRKNQNLKKLMSNVGKTGRVRTYWNNMDIEERKELFTIRIEDLIAYLDKNKLAMVKETLVEAIDFAKVKRKWKFWECCCCEGRFSVGEWNLDHIGDMHIAPQSGNIQSAAPEFLAPDLAHNLLQADVWKPVDSISEAKIMEDLPSTADNGSEGFNVSQWHYCDDRKRADIIEKIRSCLQMFMQINCLASSHLTMLLTMTMDMLQNRIPRSILEDHGLHQTLRSICLLEVPELERVLDCLEDLACACSLRFLCERFSIEESIGYQGPCFKERIVFSSDFSCLHLDERSLLRGQIDAPDDGIAVASTIAEDCGNDEAELSADSDPIVYELCVGVPKIGEQWKEWTSMRESTRNLGKGLVKILQMESTREQLMLARKLRILRYEDTLLSVERICVEENKKRELIPDYDPQSFESLLSKRKEELEMEGDAAIDSTSNEIDIILSILEEAQANTDINKAIQKQREHISREVYKLDAIILTTKFAVGQTGKRLWSVLLHDYRFIIVPLLMSFVQARLQDMVDKDAAEKSSTAAEALLAELAVDAKKNTDKGGVSSKKGDGKSKRKKKGKYHSKAKNSEGTGGSKERHPFNPKNVEQYDIPISPDELEQREQEDVGEDVGPSKQEQAEELQREAMEVQRKLEKVLEFQRKFEDEAKQKRRAEKAKIVGGTSAENVAEDVHVVFSKLSEDVGPREQGHDEELQREAMEVQRKLEEVLEFQRKFEDEAKQKRLAEKAKIVGGTSAENVAEDVHIVFSKLSEDVGPREQGHEEELHHEDEEVQGKIDEALEFQTKLEDEGKEKRLAEKVKIMENVAEDVPVISSEPGENVDPSELEHEEKFQLEDEEVQRKVDKALEIYLKFEEEVKRELLAGKAKIEENVVEEVPLLSSEPGVGPSEQEQEGELQCGDEELRRKLDEALEFYFKFEDEARRKRLAEKAKIIENVAEDVPVISYEPGDEGVKLDPSEQEQEGELQHGDEEVQRKVDEINFGDEAERKRLAGKAKIMENVSNDVPVISSEPGEGVGPSEQEQEGELQRGDEELQRKLDEALEFYFKFEDDARQKCLAEKAKIIENVAEDVPVISYEPGGEGVGPSEQEQEGELQCGDEELQRKLDEALEFYFKFEDDAQRKCLAEKAKIIENVAEDVPVISYEPGGEGVKLDPSEQEQEGELQHGDEEVQRKVDEINFEDDARQKCLAEKANIMENVANDVPVISYEPGGEGVGPSEQEQEGELQCGDEELQRKLDEALEFYFKFEDDAQRKCLAEKAKIIENVAEDVPVISYEPGGEGVKLDPSEQEQEGELQHGDEEVQRKVDEINFEDEAERKHLAGKAKIMENVANDVPVISSEPGEDVGSSEQEQEGELQRGDEELQRELDEALEFYFKFEDDARQKCLAEKAKIIENVAEDVPVISYEPGGEGVELDPSEQEQEGELQHGDEEVQRKVDEINFEDEAEQKHLAGKAKIMENVANDVPVISSEPGEDVGPSKQEREEEHQREDEVQRELDETLELQSQIDNEAEHKLDEQDKNVGGPSEKNVGRWFCCCLQ